MHIKIVDINSDLNIGSYSIFFGSYTNMTSLFCLPSFVVSSALYALPAKSKERKGLFNDGFGKLLCVYFTVCCMCVR